MARYDFPDEAWALISPMLPPERGSSQGGRPYFAHRHVMNGIFWVLCSGAPWRDLPERYGQWKTIYNRFNRWSKAGIMNSIFNKLLQILDEKALIDWDIIALDGSNVRALKAAAGAKKKHPDECEDHGLGRSRGGFGTKIHLATDGTGLPLSFCLSGGQAHESRYAETLLNRVGIIRKSGHLKSRPKAVLADKGYSGKNLRIHLKMKGIKAVIPFKSNEKASQDGRRLLDTRLYKKRNVVERCFAILKENRRIATRSEKTARNYLSMLKLGAIRLFLKRLLS
ncbi:Transposase and inactivated derivatives-like protein [Dickeya chrysanthemi Ech1591]|uniref:Transposase and inactivated derivatives-like protein n=2 Tax=Dickeya TaxID=204037 RepID=C6CQ08_DICC1|nr:MULTISPECIES: IS5 family transposase [Dickeya]ACT08885.1 Transposase and inactivated derivatives-like protein [Dickeya chrysanthemi Ech1591]WFN55196.1 IS5 family transposase [Dickeya lacustris]